MLLKIKYKQLKLASLNFDDSATALIDDHPKTLLDIINCQESGFRRKSVVLILVKIKQFIVLIMRTYVLYWTSINKSFFKKGVIVV